LQTSDLPRLYRLSHQTSLAVKLMRDLGFDPDPWQQMLEGGQARLLLNCCRQAGKSSTTGRIPLPRQAP
jgi:hypothetical protein